MVEIAVTLYFCDRKDDDPGPPCKTVLFNLTFLHGDLDVHSLVFHVKICKDVMDLRVHP